jgi:hypothetical protein
VLGVPLDWRSYVAPVARSTQLPDGHDGVSCVWNEAVRQANYANIASGERQHVRK